MLADNRKWRIIEGGGESRDTELRKSVPRWFWTVFHSCGNCANVGKSPTFVLPPPLLLHRLLYCGNFVNFTNFSTSFSPTFGIHILWYFTTSGKFNNFGESRYFFATFSTSPTFVFQQLWKLHQIKYFTNYGSTPHSASVILNYRSAMVHSATMTSLWLQWPIRTARNPEITCWKVFFC